MRNAIKKFQTRRPFYRVSAAHVNPAISSPKSPNVGPFDLRPSRYSTLEPHFISKSRLLHSLQVREEEEDDDDTAINSFLEKFVAVMRTKLSEAYVDADREVINGMLEIVVDKVVTEIEKGTFEAFKQFEDFLASLETEDFSQDLWKIVWDASKGIIEDMHKDELKMEIQMYLQSDEMKEITKFAKDAGVTGELLRDLKMHFAEQKRSEIEFYRSLDRLAGRDSTTNLLGSGGHRVKLLGSGREHLAEGVDESVEGEESEEKPKHGLPQRRAKLKFQAYGMDLSDPSWTAVGQKLEVAEKKITPEEPTVMSGKCKSIMKQILSLSDDDDPSELLTQLRENLNPRRVDWLAILQQLSESNKNIYFKATEFALNEESFEASIRDYTKLLDAYAKKDRLEDAERVLKTMTEKGFARDSVTCSALVHMYSKTGNLDRAREAFEQIRSLGLQPDQKAYGSMIMAYVQAGLPKAGESLMREMEAKDIKPGKEVYMALLRAFAQRGLVDGAQRIFNTMQFSGVMPNLESCTLLVEAYGQSGDAEQARNVFDHMMKAGHKPDDKCTASMLAAYEKKNYLDKALNLLLDLEKDGFKQGLETSAVLIDWLGRLGLVYEAEQAFTEIAGKERVPSKVCISLCDMYARSGLQQKALDTLNTIWNNAETLDSHQYERLMHGLLAGGLVEEAKRINDRMQSQGLVPSEPARVALMAAQAISRRKPTTK